MATTTTTAAVVEAPGADFAVTDIELDDLRFQEVLVKIAATELCHTDLGVRVGTPATSSPRHPRPRGAADDALASVAIKPVLIFD